ncbi:hypothetical protein E4T44_00923 [Aureobasidium sp. EXF-8845]|nr:hypothetical protein E4T44_00923 [Aureobasidium sp. EXF-8845]KAI4857139.1 hypothetical protein E4T45_01378 [Aureobasidium sp. EXF-8846]
MTPTWIYWSRYLTAYQMASALPQEILSLIADYVATGDNRLIPYTLVNRSWQSAFERQIYASVVVLSPSTTRLITIVDDGYQHKRGFDLAILDELNDARKGYIRRILYRVAVPYWLDVLRIKTEDYTYDNTWRNENNKAFSKGVQALFEHLSTSWTERTISLDIALQAEYAYVIDEDNDKGHEPDTYPFADGWDDDVAPYCAAISLDYHLPSAKCITSLKFSQIYIPTRIPDQYSPGSSRREYENRISVPVVLKIAASCGALQTLKLDAQYGTPSSEPTMQRNNRDATAAALSHLPPRLQSVSYIGDCLDEFEGPDHTRLVAFSKQDMLCTALHEISKWLRSLHIDNEVVFPELFCPPDGSQGLLQSHWPYLEILRLEHIDESSTPSALDGYADGTASDETLLERYMEDLYTNAGHAAQRMPRLNDLLVRFKHGHELSFGYYKGEWSLDLMKRRCDTYMPSSRLLEAWKVPGGQLEYYPGSCTLGAIYTSWPPV